MCHQFSQNSTYLKHKNLLALIYVLTILKGLVLMSCAQQLSPIVTYFFHLFLNCQFFYELWKTSIINPHLKKMHTKKLWFETSGPWPLCLKFACSCWGDRNFRVSSPVLLFIHFEVTKGIYNLKVQSGWFSIFSIKDKACLMRVVKTGSKIIGFLHRSWGDLYIRATRLKAISIITDSSHPLHHYFEMLPYGCWWKQLVGKKSALAKSVLPACK